MSLFARPHYTSVATQFLDELKQQKPQLEAGQQVGRALLHAPCNGWEQWLYHDASDGLRHPIDRLRAIVWAELAAQAGGPA